MSHLCGLVRGCRGHEQVDVVERDVRTNITRVLPEAEKLCQGSAGAHLAGVLAMPLHP